MSETAFAIVSVSFSIARLIVSPSDTFLKLRVTPFKRVISLPTRFDMEVNIVPLIENRALSPICCASPLSFVVLTEPSAFHVLVVNPKISVKLLVPASMLIYAEPDVLERTTSLPSTESQYAVAFAASVALILAISELSVVVSSIVNCALPIVNVPALTEPLRKRPASIIAESPFTLYNSRELITPLFPSLISPQIVDILEVSTLEPTSTFAPLVE